MNQKLARFYLVFAYTFLISFSGLWSQAWDWAPVGAKWTYGFEHFSNLDIEYREWICTKDTMVGGQLCQLIVRQGSPAAEDLVNSMITYESGGIVYWYLYNQFTVLYDFNKNVGETYTISRGGCDVEVTVVATGTQMVLGSPRKTQTLSTPDLTFDGEVLEGIGHLTYMAPRFYYYCDSIWVDGDYYNGLRCYEDLHGFYAIPFQYPCNYVLLDADPGQLSVALSVYPNPVSDRLQIAFSGEVQSLHFQIWGMDGRIWDEGIWEGQALSTVNLPTGQYGLVLNNGTNWFRAGFVVTR